MPELNLVNLVQKRSDSFPNWAKSGLVTEISEKNLQDFLVGLRKNAKSAVPAANLVTMEIVARKLGTVLLSQWFDAVNPFQAISEAFRLNADVDGIQLSLVTSRKPLSTEERKNWFKKENEGICGVELSLSGFTYRVSPFDAIAANRSFGKWFANWLDDRALTRDDFDRLGGKFVVLECRQFLLNGTNPYSAKETFRSNIVVAPTTPIEVLVDRTIAGICRWFMANQSKDGAIPYKYWPSSGEYSTADNPIRRFMASIAFNRLALHLKRSDVKAAARKNLQFNLGKFYRLENGGGQIFWQDSVKLGALSLAGLAIVESPFSNEWNEQLSAIRKSVDSLWQPDGAFKTFLQPPGRNDNQNFYPGEALLFWAALLQQQPDHELLKRALLSVDHYRGHFRERPNPAFVPWHTQAVTVLFRITKDPALRDYVFEMNDWLLPHQQWGEPVAKDCWGRFYSPEKPEFGPPHASSTGVYLEGLVDALLLALECGDHDRAKNYFQAIQRGVRSIAQLQFLDILDTYYIHHKARVVGAIRTDVTNNEIRVDNLQHPLMALMRFQDLVLHDTAAMKVINSAGVRL